MIDLVLPATGRIAECCMNQPMREGGRSDFQTAIHWTQMTSFLRKQLSYWWQQDVQL